MNWSRTSVVLFLIVFIQDSVSEGLTNNIDYADESFASGDLSGERLAGSGDNPWALPDPWQQREPPAYITNPRYVTPEDLEPARKKEDKEKPAQQEQMYQPGYVSPYGTYSTPMMGTPYGGLPGYMNYPGMGGLPFYGMPYFGNIPGFGGDPLLTPYGGSNWPGMPYGNMAPYSPQDE